MQIVFNCENHDFDDSFLFLAAFLEWLIYDPPQPNQEDGSYLILYPKSKFERLSVYLSPEELASLPEKKKEWEDNDRFKYKYILEMWSEEQKEE